MDELERARIRRKRRCRRAQSKPTIQWGRLMLVGIIALVILLGIGWGIYSGASYVYNRLTTPTVTEEKEEPKQDIETLKVEQKAVDKPIYVLVVGKDKNNPSQGDALFLMSINTSQHTMDIIGIPSNSKIESRDQQSVSMLNRMYEQDGIKLTKAVVEDMFHISIPYYVVVDETAFKKTHNMLGDQQFYVEKDMEHIDSESGLKDIDLRRGYQNLDADNAFAYLRYTDEKQDNFSRLQRQERFLKLWVDREQDRFTLTNMWHIWRLWDFYDTNISTWDAIQLMRSIGGMEKENIHFYILPGEKETIDGRIYWSINPTEAQRLVGIMTGDLSPQDYSQFVTNTMTTPRKVEANASESNGTIDGGDTNTSTGRVTTQASEPGDEATSRDASSTKDNGERTN